jgi:hypothetical protein
MGYEYTQAVGIPLQGVFKRFPPCFTSADLQNIRSLTLLRVFSGGKILPSPPAI